ncbi:zonular occludens toxin domain-containing protein [Chitinolyticbacter meiyuanensis]|uniref:zonular occludens toxin domain-containing protein n=1 Tax=Chitinolyticbacter meiyuanensis TaxID=682798 RepID=UPI0011E5D9AB|nr:zonular occludens toxin domain-containing protein [Chitinolyticbacter meiyuanensis]
MITLITGQPGAGKTLYTLWYVNQMAEKEGRQVYYSGISDLKLPWLELDKAEDWHKLPPGAIIVIDECQRVFRPRANGSQVPEHVSKCETHRHNGHDLFLITQGPRLLDGNVRPLVGRHVHVMRAFGMHAANLNEWAQVKLNCDTSRADAVKTKWGYPKEVFSYYKSAEMHTHKRRIPPRVFFLLLLPFVLAGLIWTATKYLNRLQNPQAAEVAEGQAMPAGYTPQQTAMAKPELSWIEKQQPRLDGLPHTAPAYDDLAKPQQIPAPQACVTIGDRCKCYTNQATPIQMDDDLCRNIVANGIFLPHLAPDQQQTQQQQQQLQPVEHGGASV